MALVGSIGVALLLGAFFANLAGWTVWHEVYVGLSVGLLVYVVVSLMTAKPDHPAPEIEKMRPSTIQ